MKQLVRFIDKPGRYRLHVPFVKEQDEYEVLVLILGSEKGEFDFDILVDHRARNTAGHVTIKGLANNGAYVKVGGTIKIAKNCPQVNDFLEMRMLILDGESRAEAEPRLEIESADVKASHAAAVSRISDEEIFYLNTRGIEKDQARAMLIDGFLNEVIGKIQDEKIKMDITTKMNAYGYSKN